MKRGEADLHAGLFFSDARATYLEYGSFLTETETHIFAHKQLPEIEDLNGVAPYKVGVLAGDFVENYLRPKLPRGNIQSFKTYDAVMSALAKGELQVFAADTPTGIYHLQKSGLGFDFRFDARSRLYRNKWLVAAKRGNKALIDFVDQGMQQIGEDERGAIVEKWVSLGREPIIPWELVIYTFLAALGLSGVAAIIVWSRSLKRQIALRTRELEAAKTEAERANESKSRFLATVSHELRTPLTAIGGSLSLISGGVAGEVSADAKKMIDIADASAKRLNRLINDILDFEKIRSGKMTYQFQPLVLADLLNQSIEANRYYASQYGVAFDLKTPLPEAVIHGDQDRLMQVMANLLSNAAKFSERGDRVEIQADETEEGIRVSVTDQGAGIPETFQNDIFGEFARSEMADLQHVSGTGLGLSISKSIVNAHHGKIDFDSEIERGSRFFFELPISTGPHADGDTKGNCDDT